MLTPGGLMGGRYRLQQRIATGGMGDVWKCEDTVLGRVVALKVLQPAMLEEPGFAERFRVEARVMATLNHPGVVSVHDYGETSLDGGGSVAYLVMEYVEGRSLHRLLAQQGRILPSKTMDLIAQAADALQAAHDRGIVHRDVKPGNLLVRPDGQLVLTDFGIARSGFSGTVTATGTVIGTASYVSPEQAVGDGEITTASDIYSLGVVAYQCLAGRRPFEGENPVQVALKHIRDDPPPLPGDISPSVRAVVTHAMAKDIGARWPDARGMADAARTAAAGGHVAATGLEPEPTLAQPTAAFSPGHNRVGDRPGPDRNRYVPGRSAPPTGHDESPYQVGDHQNLPGDYGDQDTYRKPPRRRRGKVLLGITAGLATVAMLVFGGPPLVNFLSSTPANPTPAEPQTPEPTTNIPNRAMLQPEDLGPNYAPQAADPQGTLRLLLRHCDTGDWPVYRTVKHKNSRGFVNAEDRYWVQYTKRYPGTQSEQYADAVREAINACQKISVYGVGNVRLVDIDEDFAGQASFLIRVEHPGEDSFHAFVRQGDMVSMIVVDAEDATEDEVRAAAKRAVKRMCAATPSC